ncbi:MAG: hypothetical protein MUE87_00215 [Methanothrix sp.]|nr:hypothetical protein [Methanothrix sp.]
MRPCIIGIGGAGGKVLKEFLKNEDIPILGTSLGEHISFGGIKGIWMDFDTSACLDEKNFYAGRLEEGHYPGFIVPPEVLKHDSKVRKYILEKYGYDLRKQGFDRRAETMKAIFEIFETDQTAKNLSMMEFRAQNPLLAYIWLRAISRFLTIGKVAGKASDDVDADLVQHGGMDEGQENGQAQEKTDSAEIAESQASSSKSAPENEDKVNITAGNHLPTGSLPNLLAIEKVLGASKSILSKIKASDAVKGENVCESILFIASLGGGTGTGFINPVTSFIRTRGSLAAVALGLFTEKGTDSKDTREEQRVLGAIIAMYDLLTKRAWIGIDALILIDNQLLQSVHGGRNYSAMNRAISDAMRPIIDQRRFPAIDDESLGIQRVFLEGLKWPGVLVPCYMSIDSSQLSKEDQEEDLVRRALSDGKLFPCKIEKSDRAYIFSRGLLDPKRLKKELQNGIGKDGDGNEKEVNVYPKIGDGNSAEILILLRNPYGGDRCNFSRNNCKEQCKDEDAWKATLSKTFEQRIYCAICMGLKYLDNYESEIFPAAMKPITKVALGGYLFGSDWIDRNLKMIDETTSLEEGDREFKVCLEEAKKQFDGDKMPFLKDELEKALMRLETGERPLFNRELNIFSKNMAKAEADITASGANQVEKIDVKALKPIIENEIRRILEDMGYPAKGI